MVPFRVRKAREWLQILTRGGRELKSQLTSYYGKDTGFVEERLKAYREVVKEFIRVYGENRECLIVRTPARINLLGLHIEHRGGYINCMLIGREIILVAGGRNDDRIELHNIEKEKYPPRAFSIDEEFPPRKRGNWLRFIQERAIKQGDWSNYVRAAVFGLQNRFPEKNLRGIELVLGSSIPSSSGLSSSSAIVVATSLAVIEFNRLTLSREELTLLCGEAEWFVGTRGGAGDHGTMLIGKKGEIAHMRFFPLVNQLVPFPSGYKIVMANSLKEVQKAKEAKDIFNEKVATYEIGLLLIKKHFPQYQDRVQYLRDVNNQNLNINLMELYQAVKTLPEKITRSDIWRKLPHCKEKLENIFSTHREPPKGYKVRQVFLYGLAECNRAEICVDFLRKGDMDTFGQLMYISHDGDRVVKFTSEGGKVRWDNTVPDQYIERLIEDLRSGVPERIEQAQLYRQPGGYGCSIEELDALVDISRGVEGVKGAGLTGAGLGGCVLIIVQEDKAEKLIASLENEYYRPRKLPLAAEVCIPVERACILTP